jgi:tetratricopeptide (TPR) repeat protein
MAKRDKYTAPRNPQTIQGEEEVPSAQETIKGIEGWYETNKKIVNGILIGILAVIVGIYAYNNFYLKPRNKKANDALFRAEQYFGMDSFNVALNGDVSGPGFLKVIDKYGSTKAGNLAHYYAGAIYLKQGEFQKAIDQLSDFDGHGTLVEPVAQGCLGDAYMELGKTDKAIGYYEQASADDKNEMLTPLYLERLGLAYEKAGNTEKAIAAFKRIRTKFSNSQQGRNADKYLARLGEYNL